MIRAAVVVDGLATGTWNLDRSPRTPDVPVEPFEVPDSAVEAGIESEVTSIGHAIDTDVELEVDT